MRQVEHNPEKQGRPAGRPAVTREQRIVTTIPVGSITYDMLSAACKASLAVAPISLTAVYDGSSSKYGRCKYGTLIGIYGYDTYDRCSYE